MAHLDLRTSVSTGAFDASVSQRYTTINSHSTDEFKALAEKYTIFQGQVGSGLHGVTTGDDDRDEMGVLIEPPEYVIGNTPFEQYIYRTQPEGVRSGKGDLDLTVYSLRKWAKLAAQGNPTVLLLGFIPEAEVVKIDLQYGEAPAMFVEKFCRTKLAAEKFLGYCKSQRDQMLGLKGRKHTNRPELVEQYGFDTKFAYHAIRLGVQGVEFLRYGRINLPMEKSVRSELTDLRNGGWTKEQAIDAIEFQIGRLEYERIDAELPEQPDYAAIDKWLVDTYQAYWTTRWLRYGEPVAA